MSRAKVGVHPGQVTSSLQGQPERQPSFVLTTTDNSEFPVDPLCSYVFGLCEEVEVPGDNPQKHRENIKTLLWTEGTRAHMPC